MQFLLLSICVVALFPATTAFPPPKTCQISDSNPKPDWDSVPKSSVNLDVAPIDRWTDLATQYKAQINNMVNQFVDHIKQFPGRKWENFLLYMEANQEQLLNRMPNGYGDEIRGIQKATGLQMSSLLAFNLGYEIMGFCTSVRLVYF